MPGNPIDHEWAFYSRCIGLQCRSVAESSSRTTRSRASLRGLVKMGHHDR